MRTFYFIFIILTAISFVGCKKSTVAPQGAQGESGSQGLKKQGSITGTITGTRKDGTPIEESFTYEYYDNSDQSLWEDGGSQYNFVSYRRGFNESQNYISFEASNLDYTSTNVDPANFQFTFSYVKDLGNGLVLKFAEHKSVAARLDFSGAASTLIVSNYSLDKTTGRLKFDYEVDLSQYENYSDNTGTVKGKVDVVIGKKYM